MTRTAIALQQLREQERSNRANEGLKHASNVLNAVGTGLQFIPGVGSAIGSLMKGAGTLMSKRRLEDNLSGFSTSSRFRKGGH